MVDVVLFGTGSNGERAWRAAATRDDINVVCFADNDGRKHGSELHARPVVGPDALGERPWDFIVLASIYAPEIQRQLHGLGFAADRIVAPSPNRFAETFAELPARKRALRPICLDDDTTVLGRDLPAVLVVTDTLLNLDDEASLPVRAILADFPDAALCNVSRTTAGRPWLTRTILLPDADDGGDNHVRLRELGRGTFQPQLIFGAVRGMPDLARLDVVLQAFPETMPIVLYVLAGDPQTVARFEESTLAGRSGGYELWAAGTPLAEALRRCSSRPVTSIAPACAMPAPAGFSGNGSRVPARARDACGRPRAVILGGIPDGSTLAAIRNAWRLCRDAVPSLSPIDWYVQPADAQALFEAGGELGSEIVWRGSYGGDALHARLADADLAIVPVNADAEAASDRARYELPTWTADLCKAGLPLVAIASADTAVAQTIDAWQCGISVSGQDANAIAASVLEVARDTERHAALGERARAIAERELASDTQRRLATSRLVRLARTYMPPSSWVHRRTSGLVRLAGSEHLRSARLEDVLTDRVHYACGRNVIAGWLNVDGYDESFPNGAVPDDIAAQIFRLDLTGRHPFPDGYFRLGYSEDFVEHLDQAAFAAFLCECYRTFQPGGALRLSSPGLEGILRRHLHGADWRAANALHEDAYARWRHKHFLCFAEVEIIAKHIGWREVRLAPYGESTITELRQDTRPDQADLNLVVEIVK